MSTQISGYVQGERHDIVLGEDTLQPWICDITGHIGSGPTASYSVFDSVDTNVLRDHIVCPNRHVLLHPSERILARAINRAIGTTHTWDPRYEWIYRAAQLTITKNYQLSCAPHGSGAPRVAKNSERTEIRHGHLRSSDF